MDEFVIIMKSLGAKITMSIGTMGMFIAGLFTLNRKLDERIDSRSESVAIDLVVVQHDQCREERVRVIEDCFRDNPRLARMETNIENISDNVKTILNLHLNGGRKS